MSFYSWIWKEIGVKGAPWRQEQTIPVRMGGETMIMLRGAKGVPAPRSTSVLDVQEVKPRDIHTRIWKYLDDLNVSGDVAGDLMSTIVPAVQDEMQRGVGKLLAVTGKRVALDSLRAESRIQDIEVVQATKYKVSFKLQQMTDFTKGPKDAVLSTAKTDEEFVKKLGNMVDNWEGKLYHRDEYGRLLRDKPQDASWTMHSLSEVNNWMSHLNWIFGSQANITMELVSAEMFRPNSPILPDAKDHQGTRDKYKPYINIKADDTVFLTGTVHNGWGGTSPPDPGEPWFSYVNDRGAGVPVASSVDKFIVLMAHEISHAIMQDPTIGGTHFCQKNILRSVLSETTIIGDVLRPLLVNRGGDLDTPEMQMQICDSAYDRQKKGWN